MGTITTGLANNITTNGRVAAGGINNSSLSDITSLPFSAGTLIPIKTVTASSSASIEFINGSGGVTLDSTYDRYFFTFNEIKPATDNVLFQFQISTDGGSNYNINNTTGNINCFHDEADTGTGGPANDTGNDTNNSTAFVNLAGYAAGQGNGADETCAGDLDIYSMGQTKMKQFTADTCSYSSNNYTINQRVAGFFDTGSAANAIKFQMSSGNIASGSISIYGWKIS